MSVSLESNLCESCKTQQFQYSEGCLFIHNVPLCYKCFYQNSSMIQENPMNEDLPPPTQTCRSHKLNLDIYCQTCHMQICYKCLLIHRSHETEDLQKVQLKNMQKVKNFLMKCEILEKTLDSLEKFIEKHEKHSTPNQSLSSNLENLMSSFFQPISENIKQEESSELKKIFQNSILKLIEEQSSEVNQSNDEKIQVFNELPEIMNSQIYNLFIMSIKEKLGMSFIYLNLHF